MTVTVAVLLALAGCLTGDDVPDPQDLASETPTAAPLEPHLDAFTGNTGNGIGTPIISVNNGGEYEFPLDRSNNTTTGYVLELTWSANDPASEQLDLWVREVGDFMLPPDDPTTLPDTLQNNQPTLKATGSSPLRLTFTPDDLAEGAEYAIWVRAATPAGLALSQDFALDVATFNGLPFDAAYMFA